MGDLRYLLVSSSHVSNSSRLVIVASCLVTTRTAIVRLVAWLARALAPSSSLVHACAVRIHRDVDGLPAGMGAPAAHERAVSPSHSPIGMADARGHIQRFTDVRFVSGCVAFADLISTTPVQGMPLGLGHQTTRSSLSSCVRVRPIRVGGPRSVGKPQLVGPYHLGYWVTPTPYYTTTPTRST